MNDRELMEQVLNDLCGSRLCSINSMSSRREAERLLDKATTALRDRLAQPDPEPVAFGYLWPTGMHPEFRYTQQKRGGIDGTPVYTAPPRRQWQGLTDEEIGKLRHLIDPSAGWSYMEFARAIEANLRERNT